MKKNIPIIILAIVVILMMAISLTGLIDENVGMCIALFLMIIFTLIVAGTAHKHDVRIIEVAMIIFMIAGSILLVLNLYLLIKGGSTVDSKFYITVSPNIGDRKELFTRGDILYYGYNVDNLMYVDTGSNAKVPLEDALENGTVTLDDILSNMVPDEGTVGYKIYYYYSGSKYDNASYSLVVCGDRDKVVFSSYEYTYTEAICN